MSKSLLIEYIKKKNERDVFFHESKTETKQRFERT